MEKIFKCNKISKGSAKGEAMVSKEPILFYHTDPETGVVIEKEHSLFERSVKDKIMVFPAGKGSSSVQADGLYKLSVNSTAPKAFIVKDLDTVLVSCAIVMEIPMVNNVEAEFYDVISDDAIIELDADKEEIKVIF